MEPVGIESNVCTMRNLTKCLRGLVSLAITIAMLSALFVTSAAHDDNKSIKGEYQRLPFEPEETLVYEGEFTRAVFRGINVADLRFSYERAGSPSGQTDKPEVLQHVLNFRAEAISKGIVSKLFGLNFRQLVESSVEAETFSVMRTRKLDEQGKRKRTSEAIFDHEAGKVTFTEIDPNDPTRPPRVVTSETTGAIQDIASAIYYLRAQELKPGTILELLISDTGQLYPTPVKISKGEKLKTVLGNVSTLLVVPEMFGEGHLIRGNGDIKIWFTADARHIPVRARINNSLGRLDIKLKSVINGTKETNKTK